MSTQPSIRVFLFLLLAVFALGGISQSWATFISPKRVIIADKQRAATITILNRSNKTMVYNFEWQRRAQQPNGKIKRLDEGENVAGYKPAEDYIVFSPRRVILKPGKKQRLRLLVRRPSDMAEGEYHSHFLIKADPAKGEETKAKKTFGGTIDIKTYAAMPVFLRHGQTYIDLNIKDARWYKKQDHEYISLFIENNSTRSIYALPKIECTTASGEISEISMPTIRAYPEWKGGVKEVPLPMGTSLANCAKTMISLYGNDDFEFRHKPVTEKIPLQKYTSSL